MDRSGKSCSWSAVNRKNEQFAVLVRALRIWSRETGSAVPSRVSLPIFHTWAESGAYSRDSSRYPRRRPFIYTAIHCVNSEFIRARHCVPTTLTAESAPARASSPQGSFSNGCCLCRYHHGPICAPPFSHTQYTIIGI